MNKKTIAAYYNIKTGIRKEGILSFDPSLWDYTKVEDRFKEYCINNIYSFNYIVQLWVSAIESEKIMTIYDFIDKTLEKDFREERLFVEDILNWDNNPDTFLKDKFNIDKDYLHSVLNEFSLSFEESEKMKERFNLELEDE